MSSQGSVRSSGLLVQWLDGEAIVYDTEHHQAHCLAPLAAAVFDLADGTHTEPALAELAGRRLDREVSHDQVTNALAELHANRLLQPPLEGVSRREIFHKAVAGAAASAVGATLITTVVTPAPAQSKVGCVEDGVPCERDACGRYDDSQCCHGGCAVDGYHVLCKSNAGTRRGCLPDGHVCPTNKRGRYLPGRCCRGRCKVSHGIVVCGRP